MEQNTTFLKTVLDSLPHPFYVIDVNDYSIVMANNTAKRLGMETGTKCYQVTHDKEQPCSCEEHPCPLAILKRTRKSTVVEHVHFDRDGKKHYVEINAHPIFDDNGKLVRMIEYTIDITQRKEVEENLRAKTEELQEINKSLDDFTSIVSHDLKQPLTSTLGYLSILEHEFKDKLSETGKMCMDNVQRVVQDMSRLIDSLLDLARIGSKSMAMEEVQCDEILDFVLENISDSVVGKDIEITRDSLPAIMGNKMELEQLFRNLINNAVKFCDKDVVRIDVTAHTKGSNWEIIIKDNGIGIPKEDLPKIFDAFERLHSKHYYPGHGIGLAICKKVVEHHNGSIHAESQEGQGTSFFIRLPDASRAAESLQGSFI